MSHTPDTPETPVGAGTGPELPSAGSPEAAGAAPPAAGTPAPRRRGRLPRVLLIVVLLGLLGYVALAMALGLRRPLYVVNGLGVPYDVTIAGQALSLPPGQPVALRVREGQVGVQIQDQALGIPPVTVAVQTPFWKRPFARALFVLNPDGTAVLVQETLQPPAATAPDAGPQVRGSLHVGLPLYAFPRPDLTFAPFPPEVASGKMTGQTRVDLLPAEVPPGEVLQAVAGNLGMEAALLLASRRLAASPEAQDYLNFLASALKPEGLVAVLQPGIAVRPVRIEWHRVYQGARQDSGAVQDVIDEYRTLLAREPHDPALQYLLGRVVETNAEAMRLFEQAVAGPNPCVYAYNALAHKYMGRGEFSQAADLAAKAVALRPDHPGFGFSHLEALMAAGRHDAALEDLRKRAAASVGDTGLLLDMLQVHLAQGGAAAVESCLKEWLADLGTKGAPADVLTGIERSVRAHVAYMTGDLETFAATAKASGDPTFAFAEALTAGRIADADVALAAVQPPSAVYHVLVFIAARRAGLADIASRHLEAAVGPMGQGGYDQRTFAEWLTGTRPFAFADLERMALDPGGRAVFLVALGVTHPDQQEACFRLARKLNYQRLFPHRFLAGIVGETPTAP